MKWWFLFFLRGVAIGGPYDTQQECLAALQSEITQPILDPGWDNAKASGLCFQAIKPQ